MRTAFYAFMLILLLPATLIACGDDDDDTGATETPSATATTGNGDPTETSEPQESATPAPEPGLFVVDPDTSNGTQAKPGTRCWAGSCLDYLGPVTDTEPVDIPVGAELQWQVEGGTADEVSHAWNPRADATVDESEGSLVWTEYGEITFETGDIVVPEEPGEYLLSIFIRYTTGDDVLWGLYVNAE